MQSFVKKGVLHSIFERKKKLSVEFARLDKLVKMTITASNKIKLLMQQLHLN